MDTEVEFFHKTFAGKDPKALMDHIEKMASGEAQFFPMTLSLVYGKLARKVLARPTAPEPSLGKSPGTDDGFAGPTSPFMRQWLSTLNQIPPPTHRPP